MLLCSAAELFNDLEVVDNEVRNFLDQWHSNFFPLFSYTPQWKPNKSTGKRCWLHIGIKNSWPLLFKEGKVSVWSAHPTFHDSKTFWITTWTAKHRHHKLLSYAWSYMYKLQLISVGKLATIWPLLDPPVVALWYAWYRATSPWSHQHSALCEWNVFRLGEREHGMGRKREQETEGKQQEEGK